MTKDDFKKTILSFSAFSGIFGMFYLIAAKTETKRKPNSLKKVNQGEHWGREIEIREKWNRKMR